MAGWGSEKSEIVEEMVSDLIKRVKLVFGANSQIGRESAQRVSEALSDSDVLRAIYGAIATRCGNY